MDVGIEFLPLQVDTFGDLSIQQLLELCLGAESTEAAWCEFVRRTQRIIAGSIYKVVHGRLPLTQETIEDLTSTTYLKLFKDNCKYLRNFKPKYEDALFSFLTSVARTVAEDYDRKRKRGREDQLDEHSDPPAPDLEPWRKVLVEEVLDYVKKQVSEQEYDIFLLHYRLGLTARAISELPGIKLTENQVEYVLWQLMRLLKDKFGCSSNGPPSGKND